ncbi:MAG: hypothetical protein A2073_05175 [Deltaproteobacteria bacterium GWC2_42_11]|nr:MAG: hypothetical protein A2073_05175 [Deltaproteobacteria bacterium GWC2_42_11]
MKLILSAIGFGVVLILGYLFYQEPFQPGRGIGYYLGITGCLIFLFVQSYPLGKKVKILERMAEAGLWLNLHIILGISGTILVLYHTSFMVWNYTNLAFFAFWLMVFLLINGIIGSYIYTQRLRGIGTKELTMKEINEMSRFISEVLKERGIEDINLHEVSMSFYKGGKGFGNFKVLGIAAFNDLFIIPLKIWGFKKMLRRDLRLPSWEVVYISGLVKRYSLFRRRVDQYEVNERLFGRWQLLHRVFSLAFLFVMVIHSVTGYLFAIK